MFAVISDGGLGEHRRSGLHVLFVTSTVVGAFVVLALLSINVVAVSRAGTLAAPAGLIRSATVLSRSCLARLLLTVAALIVLIVLSVEVGSSVRNAGAVYIAIAFFTLMDCLVTLGLAVFARGAVRRLGSFQAR